MGFVIWYLVEFPSAGVGPGAAVRASNDAFRGQFALDADVELTMTMGETADTFRVTLRDLPADVAEGLRVAQQARAQGNDPLRVRIHLGYFDDPSTTAGDPTLTGVVTGIRSTVGDDGVMSTVVTGEEVGGFLLRRASGRLDRPGRVAAATLVAELARRAGVALGRVEGLDLTLEDVTMDPGSALAALRELGRRGGLNVLVRDNAIHIGRGISQNLSPLVLDPDVNLVQLDGQQESDEPGPAARAPATGPGARSALQARVLGHPRLRVGQPVELAASLGTSARGPRWVSHLVHKFSTATGYTCELQVLEGDPALPTPLSAPPGAHRMAERLFEVAGLVQDRRAAVDVARVESSRTEARVATLGPGAGASAEALPGGTGVPPRLHSKPIASPFAWHRCGLITPVYPGMRVVTLHQRGEVNDAVVAGSLWDPPSGPAAPADVIAPPDAKPGDYWLCLPTAVGSDHRPVGKGVNDLTDGTGVRVVEARGLRFTVGEAALTDVGRRPEVPAGLAQTMEIVHASGTRILIDKDGAITIDSGKNGIALTTTDGAQIRLSNGKVSLTLDNESVQVSKASS